MTLREQGRSPYGGSGAARSRRIVDRLSLPTVSGPDALNTQTETSIDSGATTDLSLVVVEAVTINGTSTITAFGTLPYGARRRCKFAASLTLTYNATSLILPTLANIVTTAGDVASMFSLGDGNWDCLVYAPAAGSPLGVVPITKGGTGQITAVAGKDALTVQSSSIAANPTTDLSLATGEAVTITGSATITSFSTVAAGAKRTLTFTGVPILTHKATSLILE